MVGSRLSTGSVKRWILNHQQGKLQSGSGCIMVCSVFMWYGFGRLVCLNTISDHYISLFREYCTHPFIDNSYPQNNGGYTVGYNGGYTSWPELVSGFSMDRMTTTFTHLGPIEHLWNMMERSIRMQTSALINIRVLDCYRYDMTQYRARDLLITFGIDDTSSYTMLTTYLMTFSIFVCV